MTKTTDTSKELSKSGTRSPLMRSLKISLIVIVLLLIAITVGAWMMGGQTNFPFAYDGFD